MKKVVLLAVALMFASVSANAQLGNLLNKAAQKAGEKATEAASNAVKNRLGLGGQNQAPSQEVSGKGGVGNYQETSSSSSESYSQEELPTIQELMAQMPALPTVAQLIDYKNAEANEQTLKLMTSPITMFRTQVATLGVQAMAVGYSNLDSNSLYNMATQLSGLTAEEIKAMEGMTDEQQEAFMMNYYQSGRADEARQRAEENAAKYAEMISKQVEQYEAVDAQVEEIYKNAQMKMKPIYKAYANRLENAEGKDYNRLMAEYYSKVVALQRGAVEHAMMIRKSQQLPIAEEIEKINEGIRKKDPGAVVPSYVSTFAMAYFGEVEKLFSVPTYFDEED